MAIPQERYIEITTGEGSSSINERNLQTLVFTDSSAQTGTTFTTSVDVSCTNINAVATAFGATSKEYLWAAKYFGFFSPNGTSPTTLTFAKIGSGETPVAAFNRVSARTNGFGTFSYLVDLTASEINAVASANAAKNYKFQFIAPVALSAVNAQVAASGKTKLQTYVEACVGAGGTKGTHLVYQKAMSLTGTIAVPKTYILAAILSSVDWSRAEGTISPMFRTLSNENPDVFGESDVMESGSYTDIGADTLDAKKVNYYGKVQTNGLERSFYQRGMNTDQEFSLVYMGEVWLKSEISTQLLSMMLSLSKIKANTEGNARIYATVDSVCGKAVYNGVIEPGMTLDTTARNQIFMQTQDSTASDIIETRGYWLKTWIEKESSGENYKAKYLLLYAKQGVVVKVEGSDVLY